jgi:regulatory protein
VPPPPLITRVQPLRPRGLKVLLHLDRGEPLELTLEALERARLGVGDPLPPARLHHLLNDDADVRVRDAALNLISYRARTRAELARRLRQKGFRPARIDPCLDRLEAKGFIDDGAVAEAFVRDRLRHRPKGKSALSAELRAKGVDGELVSQAIDRVFEDADVDDATLARLVTERWIKRQNPDLLEALASPRRTPEGQKARRRLTGYLTRRGFRGSSLQLGIEHGMERSGDRRS